MAPLLPGGLLGGFEDIVGGVGGSEEGAWTSSTVSGGLRAAVETGEPSLLLHLRLCHACLRHTSMPREDGKLAAPVPHIPYYSQCTRYPS